jgi:hypothetical protein
MNEDDFRKRMYSIYYYNTPKILWRILSPIFEPFILSMREKSFDREFSLLTLIRISGKPKFSDNEITISIFGSEIETAYYAQLFFEKISKKEEFSKKIPFSLLAKAIKNEESISDIVIARASQLHSEYFWNTGALVIPDQVNQDMELPKDFSEIEKKFNKILNSLPIKFELGRIETEISTSSADLRYFYDKMYVPSVKNRFDEKGFIYPFEELEEYYKHGAIIFLKNDGNRIAGTLLRNLPDRVAGVVVGVNDGEKSLLRAGYLPKLYLESFRYAHSKKYDKMNLGHSKSFLMDGVLRFKKKIGASVTMQDSPPIIHGFYFTKEKAFAAAKVLEQNSFIGIRKNKLFALKVFTYKNPLFSEVINEKKKASIDGINKILILAPEFSDETKKLMAKENNTILIEEKDFTLIPSRIKEALD